MKVLIGCEESQEVCKAFRALGHEAYSCDLQECSGGHPEWHIKGDVLEAINIIKPDLGIFHPPCTYLTVTGNAWFNIEKYGEAARERHEARLLAAMFFMKIYNSKINKIAIENPIGFINGILKPNQIIQPYFFGDEAQKTTCLWLKNVPKLYHNAKENLFDQNITHVAKGEIIQWVNNDGKKKSMPKWYSDARKLPKNERSEIRSKTFPGIARAMAEQWGGNITKQNDLFDA